jgi:hypothetical protein
MPRNNWFNSNITVHFTASDSGSGLASVTSDVLITTDCVGQTVVRVAYDAAGNSAGTSVGPINLDRTKPTVGSIVLPTSVIPGAAFIASPPYVETNLDQAIWDWSDGSTSEATRTGTTASGTHIYSTAGTYTVKLTVTDKAGQHGICHRYCNGSSCDTDPDSLANGHTDGAGITDVGACASVPAGLPGTDRWCDARGGNEKEIEPLSHEGPIMPFVSLFL